MKKKSYKFGSVEAIVAAGSNERQAMEGIGKNLAEKVKHPGPDDQALLQPRGGRQITHGIVE